jgi:hypothetical protein
MFEQHLTLEKPFAHRCFKRFGLDVGLFLRMFIKNYESAESTKLVADLTHLKKEHICLMEVALKKVRNLSFVSHLNIKIAKIMQIFNIKAQILFNIS